MKKIWDYLWERLVRYALKFGVVGLAGYAIDVGVFNLLRLGVFGDEGWFSGPIGAKVVSVTLATLATWFGNRYWTFREHRRKNFLLELFEFSIIAVLGLGISLGCLYVSHYLLGYNNLLADNISGNVIGLVLATAFRFLLYRYWVFAPHRADGYTAMQNARLEADAAAAMAAGGAAPGEAADAAALHPGDPVTR
ncbi:GtrA family protein [Herbiconiux sp. P17]|uniref:GtrA family protein n=1 Tax=Herbiconiux wuyangfengii TaxID=3342794 RepID=UPI0035B8F83D